MGKKKVKDEKKLAKQIKKAEEESPAAHTIPKTKKVSDKKLQKEFRRVFGKAFKASAYSNSSGEPRVSFDGARRRGKDDVTQLAVDVLRDLLYMRLQSLPSAE